MFAGVAHLHQASEGEGKGGKQPHPPKATTLTVPKGKWRKGNKKVVVKETIEDSVYM